LIKYLQVKFRTEIPKIEVDFDINFRSKITMLGSCFTENIGNLLIDNQFDVAVNPFNIVFNPVSISQQLTQKNNNRNHFVSQNGKVFSLDCHSKFNGDSIVDLEQKISESNLAVQKRMNETDVLILTFGTAWVYKFNTTGLFIGNCQKQPSDQFTKTLLKSSNLEQIYNDLFSLLLSNNPNLKIIVTVSPVRHLKDGLVENNRSKAILLSLCQFLESKFANSVMYYPSYEIVLDDLRDYRFYKNDLLHPNDTAVQYIYEHFKHTFFNDNTTKVLEKISKYNKLKRHKDLHSSPEDIEKRQVQLDVLRHEIDVLKLS